METGRRFEIIRRYHMYVESKKKIKESKLISLQNSNRLRDRKKNYIYQREKGCRRDKLGVWGLTYTHY